MSTIPAHEVIVIDPSSGQAGWQGLRQQCYDVRIDVFHHEQGFPLDTEIDEYVLSYPLSSIPSNHAILSTRSLEDSSTHFLLRLVPSLKPVGTIRYTKFKNYSKLSRLAVLKDYRQHKFGRALVETLHKHAVEDAIQLKSASPNKDDILAGVQNVIRIVSHSQLPVKAFYAR